MVVSVLLLKIVNLIIANQTYANNLLPLVVLYFLIMLDVIVKVVQIVIQTLVWIIIVPCQWPHALQHQIYLSIQILKTIKVPK